MRKTFAFLLFASMLTTTTVAQDGPIDVPYKHFKLENGLNVILHRDTSVPMISTNIWYHVGSSNEKPGRTGFAHLFEHIMFEGSKNVPEGKIDEWFEEVGGSPNGSTNKDRTNYMQTFSSNALDLALFIESDRMGYLLDAMSPASVDGQRDVVKNERRQSYENRPYGLAYLELEERLYPADYPYHWPVIGYMDDLSAASYEDVQEFFTVYYAPNNASLAISGDIDYEEAENLVRKWFSEIPAQPNVDFRYPPPPAIEEETRLVMEDQVQLPRLYMAWHAPARYAPGSAEMDVVAELLAGGKNSLLYKKLVYELQIAQSVSAYPSTNRFSSEFVITATARTGHTLAELESVILETIDQLANVPPDVRDVDRIRNQAETSFLEQLESLSQKADRLNEYFYYTGNPGYFEEDIARVRALSPDDLSAMTRQYLQTDKRVILSVVPTGQLELAAPNSVPIIE